MPAYRRKLEVIDAIQLTGPDSANAITLWSQGLIVAPPVFDVTPENPSGLYMEFEHTKIIVSDWVIKQSGGKFQVMTPTAFEEAYVEGDAKNDLPKTATNPFGIDRRKADTGQPERRGLAGRSTEALRQEVGRLRSENATLAERINVAVTSLQVLRGAA